MPTVDFLPFCPNDTGTNLVEQSAYAGSAGQLSGNVPGIASSQLVNKALRQGSTVASALANYIANTTQTAVNDNGVAAQLISQVTASMQFLPPVLNAYTATGSGTYYLPYVFFIASGNATSGATYSNGSGVFTVSATVSSGLQLSATGTAAPSTSGVLTKVSGTGDATINFYAVRAPIALYVKGVGGGGGGSGSGTAAGTAAGAGGATSFGTTLISAGGGSAGTYTSQGGAGGSASLGTGPIGIAIPGGSGGGSAVASTSTTAMDGGAGASSAFGGAGGSGWQNSNGLSGVANSGSGGGGGGCTTGAGSAANYSGAGGGAGGFVNAIITSPSATYAYAVGTAGAAGGAGSAGTAGGAGGSGVIVIEARFQ